MRGWAGQKQFTDSCLLLLMMVPEMACDNRLSFQLQALLCPSRAPSRCIRAHLAVPPPSHCSAPLLPRARSGASCRRLRTALQTRPETRTWINQPRVPTHLIPRCFPRSIPAGGGRGALHGAEPGVGRWQCLPADEQPELARLRQHEPRPQRAIVPFSPGTPSAPRLYNSFLVRWR